MSRVKASAKHPMPRLRDGDLLRGRPPSLWGIVPLQTPIERAREILQDKGVLKPCKEYRAPGTGATGIARWPHFNLNYENGIVKFVEFQPAVDITVAEVLAAHGTPEGVLSCYTDFPGDRILTVMILFYDALWTMVSLAEQEPRTYVVAPDTRVARITYSKPHPSITKATIRVPWQGYGDYPATDATGD